MYGLPGAAERGATEAERSPSLPPATSATAYVTSPALGAALSMKLVDSRTGSALARSKSPPAVRR